MGYKVNFRVIGDKPPFVVTLHEDDITNPAVLTKTVTSSDVLNSFNSTSSHTINPLNTYCVKAVDSFSKQVSVCDVTVEKYILSLQPDLTQIEYTQLGTTKTTIQDIDIYIPENEEVILKSTMPSGFNFLHWETINFPQLNNSTANPLTFNMPNVNFTIKPIKEAIDTDSFIFTIDTRKITNTQLTFRIPVKFNQGNNYSINWGDGTISTKSDTNKVTLTHTYSVAGVYQVKISGNCIGIEFGNEADKLLSIDQWGRCGFYDMSKAFQGCSNLTKIPNPSTGLNKDWSQNVVDMSYMFAGSGITTCYAVWDTSNVENMKYMFSGCDKLTNVTFPVDVSNVVDMSYMFNNCHELSSLTIGSWSVPNLTNTERMFSATWKIKTLSLRFTNIDTITNTKFMFYDVGRFNAEPPIPVTLTLDNWNINNITFDEYFLTETMLQPSSYQTILQNWSSQSPKRNLTVSFGKSKYTPTALTYKNKLINDFNWRIYDDGPI